METLPADSSDSAAGREEFETYVAYNSILRSWFVAFGVGGPALFLTNANLADRLVQAHEIESVALLFLFGTGAQVVGAAVNKVCNWYVYHGAHHTAFRETWRYKGSHWLVHLFELDVILDLLTVALFARSAWLVLTVFART